ncbi:antibiotic biosynthesis monooxygenase family protein [Nocardia jiangxiensis]|uniref:Antibiotic biosynthesis monooxygenase family protein n=1 Tax=Nocardia jiangxiensis TaxID=282685 RepID=A0ABW6RZ35_9NOCA|nr:antibiotic biosynthesis monooxygenase family protein [Nocardia jiangxiensis]
MPDTTTIATDAQLTTLINVFTVQPDRQRTLVDLLTRATDEVMQHIPGFISANIHASDDGTRVINYAQWQSPDAYREVFANPTAQIHMKQAAAVADHFDPHLFTVESVHHR